VDVWYFDPYVKRARIAFAEEESLTFVPSWYGHRMLAMSEQRAARISLAGPTTTGLLDDLDPGRAGRDQLPFIKEILTVISDRTTNWTVVPCPTEPWAQLVHPDLPPDEALDRLWEEVAHVCRLDEPDPVAAWKERADTLSAAADRLNERRFDALHFEGPGTDLTIGLLPTSTFHAAREQTVGGIVHLANLPTEEVFATPDPQRADGRVRSTKPLVLADGTIIRGLETRFEGGRAVEIDAEQGAGVMRGRVAFDDGAARLGEVALVDREGRIGRLGTVFYDTLLDENAASHIALGDGFDQGLSDGDRARRNRSSIHIDFMIGGDDVAVTGITRDGHRVPVLRDGSWQI
jgi:aminopeptidase